ncbi:toxin VasX [Vreelandella titanicae]|uniref:Toxin VasX N-terminal region domain-containing protein n=1 Tax=Vreelandella titanicae TaxID=664683 RepID=A0A558J807_9GAMM|nr:toxin VasX [Halomonas titanicae]TVU89777.1 hypothetical protein FQP89_10580 [Halomonas titanicae]
MSQELSQHKACEEPKLFIQVLGKDHPEGHRFFFYDEHDEQEQPGLTDAVEEEDLPEPVSRIHSWEWEAEPNRNVWLEIASEEGDTIRVPLFAGVGQTPWQEHERDTVFQQYVVQPIVPLALWQSLVDDASHALPSRPGYLYIHYRGALWREIEVSVSEADEWQFKDVDLAKHRDKSDAFVDDRRSATGQSLTEIWLPARRASSWLSGEVKVAFSDVQWSAARLNCLENDSTEVNQRFQSVSLQSPSERVVSGQLLAAEQLVPQRQRTPCLELQIAHPPLWVEDLSGSAVSSLYQHALGEQQSFDKGGPEAVNGAWNEANRDASPLKREVGLRAAAADVVCQAYRPSSTSTQPEQGEEPPNWEELPDGGDVLEDARQRHIPGLIINDPLFELRHALSQMQLSQNYLSILLERCAAQPHYRSAIMVQKRIMPEYIGGESNPLRSLASNQALKYLGGEFHTSVATLARDVAHRLWEFHQTRLAELIGNSAYQRALVDYFSLEESDYLSGFCLAEQCFTALSLDPKRVDILVDEAIPTLFHTANAATAQRTLVSLLEEGSTAPLHAMCFPDSEAHPVDQPFVLPEEESNDGTGRFRAKALADESKRGDPPDTENLQTVEVSLLAAAARLNAIGELNRWSGAMDNVFGRIALSGKSILSQVADQGERTAMAARIYMPPFNASRGALHTLLGDLTFQPTGNMDMNHFVLLGVEDVQSGMTFGLDSADRNYIARNGHRQFYGDIYRTSSGEQIGSTNQGRLPSIKNIGEAREVRFIFAPIDSDAAEMVRQGRERIGFTERAIGTTRLPYLMVAFQAMNLGQSAAVIKSGEDLKKISSLVAALFDLGLATLNLSDYITRRYQAYQFVISTSQFSQKIVISNGQANLFSRMFPRLITANWIVARVAGVMAAVTMAWEAMERFKEGDMDAAVAYGFAAVGAAMVLVFSGPVGWVGLALLVGGAVTGIMLTDGPLEQWVKHGPFGDQRGVAPWLEEPEEAYYRLQGILANITITARRVPPQERDALMNQLGNTHNRPTPTSFLMGQMWQEHLQQRPINTVIEVKSSLPGMGVELQDVAIIKRLEGKTYNTPAFSGWVKESETQITPILTQLSVHTIRYFVYTPEGKHALGAQTGTGYRWEARVQFREMPQVPFQSNNRFYPAPEPLKETPSNMAEVFDSTSSNSDYWVKETLNV